MTFFFFTVNFSVCMRVHLTLGTNQDILNKISLNFIQKAEEQRLT